MQYIQEIGGLEGMTIREAWISKKPSICHMRIIRCIVCAKIPNSMRSKLETEGTRFIFLGYCKCTKAYRLMCLDTKIRSSKGVM
jgi:hypothetical protein